MVKLTNSPPIVTVEYPRSMFNRRPLSRAQATKIAAETVKLARLELMPDMGGIDMAYDAVSNSWWAWYYRLDSKKQCRQVGFNAQAGTAIGALRHLEELNLPDPETVQAAWDAQEHQQ